MADRPGQKPGKPGVVIIADDLTGACDSAVAFATGDTQVVVGIAPDAPARGDVFSLNTRSRDVAVSDAIDQLASAARSVGMGSLLFKKIDSVFRGNTFAEIAASVQLLPADLAILAPAYPALGRRVRRGQLLVHAETETALDICEKLRPSFPALALLEAGLPPLAIRERLQQSAERGVGLILCDAIEQRDLDALVEAATASALHVLWIGSGGLAHALAGGGGAPPRPLPRRGGRVLFFAGSDHAATAAQIDQLRQQTGLLPRPCDAGSFPDGDALFQVIRNVTTHANVRSAVESIASVDVGCILATGGDTALLVCEALGIQALLLQGELAPGVPLAIAQGRRFDGVPFVLKSGGFGDPELLCRLHAMFAGKEVVSQ